MGDVASITLTDPGTLPTVAAPADAISRISTALMLAAVHIVTDLGGTVKDPAVQWGASRAFPTCCGTVRVAAIASGPVPRNGTQWAADVTRWEVLVSQDRPKIDTTTSGVAEPEPGDLDDLSSATHTGHAYRMARIHEAIVDPDSGTGLLAVARLYLGDGCGPCEALTITDVQSETDTCDQIRYTVETVWTRT